MRLELRLDEHRFVVQEPIPLRLRFVNGDREIAFPRDHESGDVVTLTVRHAEGPSLGSFDGYTQDQRLGLEPSPQPQEAMLVGRLPPGAQLDWTADLCSYVDLSVPGRYVVEAELSFHPSGVRALLSPTEFEVVANHVQAFDALLDAVATPVLHTAQVHEDARGAMLLVHARAMLSPSGAWSGGAMAVPRGTRPRVAAADFTTRATFAHDFARWLAWTTDRDTLALRRFSDSGWEPLREHPLPRSGAVLVGRPISHADGGLSVLLAEPGDAGSWRVAAAAFTSSGDASGEASLAHLPAQPHPAVTTGARGSTFVLSGQKGALPLVFLSLTGQGASSSVVLDDATLLASLPAGTSLTPAAVLGVGLERGPRRDAPGAEMLAAVMLGQGERLALWLGAARCDERGATETWRARVIDIPPGLRDAGESMTEVALASEVTGKVAALLVTSRGRIFECGARGLVLLAEFEPAVARSSSLVVLEGKVRRVLPTVSRGLVVD